MSALFPAISPDSGVSTASLPSGHLLPKRNRTQLSCTHCRHAKLKCDRKLPCSPCVKKGRSGQCTFPPPATRKKPTESMQNRLRHLENLVKDVMNAQAPVNNTGSSDCAPLNGIENNNTGFKLDLQGQAQVQGQTPGTVTGSPMTTMNAVASGPSGQLIQSAKETTYVGATHWAAILEDIEEVKSYFNETEPEDYHTHKGVEPNISMLFNFEPHSNKGELLGSLPPRWVVDKLVFQVFDSSSSTRYLIHKPTFQKEYDGFWADPSGVSLSWLAQLYALMTLGSMVYFWSGQQSPETGRTPFEMIRTYRSCCAQCLVLSNYTQPGPHTIEAFIIFMESEFLLSNDEKVNCFLLVGSVVRLSLRIGLHRDPSKMGGVFTPFQAEIRRRIWHVLLQIDLLAGFHLGLPSMIAAVESDTESPRNLKDEDFYEDIPELPLGRPETEPTPILYLIVKSRICDVFGKIAAQANRLSLPPYDEVLKVDELLNGAFAKVPTHLRSTPLGLSVTDSSGLIMQRFNISLLYNKSRCVLHRKYLIRQRENYKYAYSKKVGLDASMEILAFQLAIFEAIQLGGPLAHEKWYITSLPMHDFLLAATIVFIFVMQMVEDNPPSQYCGYSPHRTRKDLISALQKSYDIWKKTQDISLDTKRAFIFVGFMLEKIKAATLQDTSLEDTRDVINSSTNNIKPNLNLMSELSMDDYMPAAVPQNTTSICALSSDLPNMLPFTAISHLGSEVIPSPMENFGSMLDMTTDFDWDAFDSHIRLQHQALDQPWPDSMLD